MLQNKHAWYSRRAMDAVTSAATTGRVIAFTRQFSRRHGTVSYSIIQCERSYAERYTQYPPMEAIKKVVKMIAPSFVLQRNMLQPKRSSRRLAATRRSHASGSSSVGSRTRGSEEMASDSTVGVRADTLRMGASMRRKTGRWSLVRINGRASYAWTFMLLLPPCLDPAQLGKSKYKIRSVQLG